MSLEAGFGINLEMLISPSSDWQTIYIYYNHGLEPPHGGVRSEATTEDLEMNVGWFDRVMGWTDDWIGMIAGITDNHIHHDPDLPLNYNLRALEADEGDLDEGDIVFDITMETLNAEFVWTKAHGQGEGSPKVIIFKPRPAFDLSWAGFLFYVTCLKDFSAKVKEQQ